MLEAEQQAPKQPTSTTTKKRPYTDCACHDLHMQQRRRVCDRQWAVRCVLVSTGEIRDIQTNSDEAVGINDGVLNVCVILGAFYASGGEFQQRDDGKRQQRVHGWNVETDSFLNILLKNTVDTFFLILSWLLEIKDSSIRTSPDIFSTTSRCYDILELNLWPSKCTQ